MRRTDTEICVQLNGWYNEAKNEPDTLHHIITSMYVLGLEFGLNRSEEEVNKQLDSAIEIKKRLEGTQSGIGICRMITRYIDGLQWVLGNE